MADASCSRSHPRRRAVDPGLDADSLTESLANMSLRKGVTFHSPSLNDSHLLDLIDTSSPTFPIPRSLTSRSTTCPKELEDLLVGAGERRVVDFLAKVDKAVNNKSKEELGIVLSEPDVLPVPAFLLEGATLSSNHPDQAEDEAYDSGLGSSIDDEATIKAETKHDNSMNLPRIDNNLAQQYANSKFCCTEAVNKTRKSSRSGSAVTRSMSSVTSQTDNGKYLSLFATGQVHRYLLRPILGAPALKDFHKLVAQVPRRIVDGQITNLRDLEKTLIFLAPVSVDHKSCHLYGTLAYLIFLFQDFSRSPAAYLQFCETSIHCLQATVNNVHESDQRLPTDRPYTNNYFLDLVQQIRRYAQILAVNRQRQARGEDVEDMDISA